MLYRRRPPRPVGLGVSATVVVLRSCSLLPPSAAFRASETLAVRGDVPCGFYPVFFAPRSAG